MARALVNKSAGEITTLHFKKCKGAKGWELCQQASRGSRQELWSRSKGMLLKCLHSLGTVASPISVRIHDIGGKFQEERTYPRSADPKKSKG